MPKIQRSALVAYSAQSMFDLVNDVESYSEFLPGCSDSKIVSQQGNAMQAALLVFPVHGGGYDGVTLAVPRTNEAVYFALIKQ